MCICRENVMIVFHLLAPTERLLTEAGFELAPSGTAIHRFIS